MLETIARADEKDKTEESYNGEYVNWRDKKVKIPSQQYNAGGRLTKYTAEKVLSILDFYYKMILIKDSNEIRDEEQEERHHKSLLDAAITVAVSEKACSLEDLHFLQINRKVHGRKHVQDQHH